MSKGMGRTFGHQTVSHKACWHQGFVNHQLLYSIVYHIKNTFMKKYSIRLHVFYQVNIKFHDSIKNTVLITVCASVEFSKYSAFLHYVREFERAQN